MNTGVCHAAEAGRSISGVVETGDQGTGRTVKTLGLSELLKYHRCTSQEVFP